MTNYAKFPTWKKYGILIKFSEDKYSWTYSSPKQIKYMLESPYCDKATEFFVIDKKLHFFSLDEFRNYLLSL